MTHTTPFTIGGIAALELVAEYGTPIYVYDGNRIQAQYQRLKNAFAGIDFHIKYACKANTNLSILRLLRSEGAGLDTVSIEEVQTGLRAGYEPREILFTPNSVSFEEIREAVKLGVCINIDNISILEQFGSEYGGTVPLCLRINPHIVGGGHHEIQTGHIDSKFGVSIHQLRHAARVVKATGIHVEGVHMHTGSDIKETSVFLRGLEVLLDVAMDFPDLRYIDYGSGFKVAYQEGDIVTDIEELGTEVAARFKAFCTAYGKPLELWTEPGKFLVSEAGYFLTSVNVLKQTISATFAGINSGMNHLLRPKLYDAYHHIVNVSNLDGVQRVYTVVGYICETDTFGWDRKLGEVRVGDVLCFLNAGAYGFSMASNYNSRFRPAEVLVVDGTHRLIRRAETLDDLLRLQM